VNIISIFAQSQNVSIISVNGRSRLPSEWHYFRALVLTAENTNEWLNESIFTTVIRNHLNLSHDDYKIVAIDSKPATKPGDNYMAVLFRTKVEIERVDGRKQQLSYIVKCLISSVFDEQLVNGYDAFPKEKQLYSDLIPKFEKLYANVGVDVSFGPRCFYTAEDPVHIIIMEDLSDYKMGQRCIGLDQNHIELGLLWLAKFHAASMVHEHLEGPFADDFKQGIFAPHMESLYQPYYDAYFDCYIEGLRKLPNGDRYISKVEKWKGILYRNICKSLEYDASSFNVLNHGDMWVSSNY